MVFGQTCVDQNTNITRTVRSIEYTSDGCWKWQNGDGTTNGKPNDRNRLERVITATAGKIIFDESEYWVSGPITLPSFRILEGTGVSPDKTHKPSKIILTGTNTSIFTIGKRTFEVAIRDINLQAENKTGTIGIKAEGNNLPVTIDDQVIKGSSAKFQFSNVRFNGFDKGIAVISDQYPWDWQFDNVRLDHCTFDNNRIGIEIFADNSGWNMSNNVFYIPKPQETYTCADEGKKTIGINILRAGYVSMNLMVGNGATVNGAEAACEFIHIQRHNVLSIQNSVAEGVLLGLNLNGLEKVFPIHLINNNFGPFVSIKDSTVVSTGNFYGKNQGYSYPPIKGKSDVFSIGDRFCYQLQEQYCVGDANNKPSQFIIEKNNNNIAESSLFVQTNNENASTALMKIQYPWAEKVLLELGNFGYSYNPTLNTWEFKDYKYSIKRDSNGWLSFEGNQSNPYRGFKFNGPVQLPTYLLADLPLGTPTSGSMAFCSNCQPNTTPCQSGGSGALALFVTSQWNCK